MRTLFSRAPFSLTVFFLRRELQGEKWSYSLSHICTKNIHVTSRHVTGCQLWRGAENRCRYNSTPHRPAWTRWQTACFFFKHRYPLHSICIILIKRLLRSIQSMCHVESRRTPILLYVNLRSTTYQGNEYFTTLKQHRGVFICISMWIKTLLSPSVPNQLCWVALTQ